MVAAYSVRDVALPQDARSALTAMVAAASPPSGWRRLKAAFFPAQGLVLQEQAARAGEALARGTCREVLIEFQDPPLLSEHEHGLLVFVPLSEAETLLLDLGSVSDDPRWALHETGNLLRRSWRWLRIDGLETSFAFRAEGPPIEGRRLPEFHGTALERRLAEEVDWPGDDAVLPLSVDEIERLSRG